MTRLRTVAPLLVASALAGVALFTATHAGCDDPGRYLPVPGGYELVGGCVDPADLVVVAPPAPAPVTAGPGSPSRS
jgi:hypothetical protein